MTSSLKLSKTQRRMLTLGERYIHGAGEVRTARSLEALGLVHLDDCGYMRADDARWYLGITDAGKAIRGGS